MRTVNIDLSQDITESREKIYVGYTGEHNATELVVKIPQEMASESDYLVAVFLNAVNKRSHFFFICRKRLFKEHIIAFFKKRN